MRAVKLYETQKPLKLQQVKFPGKMLFLLRAKEMTVSQIARDLES